MSRHVRVVNLKTFNGNTESDPANTLAKAVYDLINAKTVVSISVSPFGQNPIAVVVYDD
jgi:hypothetical protein